MTKFIFRESKGGKASRGEEHNVDRIPANAGAKASFLPIQARIERITHIPKLVFETNQAVKKREAEPPILQRRRSGFAPHSKGAGQAPLREVFG